MPAEEGHGDVNERIVIITGASPLLPEVVDRIPDDAIVLAVDGGLDHALAAGLEPSGLIGDLDSVTEDGLAWAARHATIDRHPTDKEQTDTELALAFAAAMDPLHVTMIGGGDRLDHSLAAIGALGAPVLTSIPTIDGWWDDQHLEVLHGPGKTTLRLVPGSTLSLLAMHGRCQQRVDHAAPTGNSTSSPSIRWSAAASATRCPTTADRRPVDVEVDSLSSGVLTIFDVPAPSTTEVAS